MKQNKESPRLAADGDSYNKLLYHNYACKTKLISYDF